MKQQPAVLLGAASGQCTGGGRGGAGCGKSTQVPQFVLEDAIAAGTGGACNIIVTQPRRISATGLVCAASPPCSRHGGDAWGGRVLGNTWAVWTASGCRDRIRRQGQRHRVR